MQRLFSVPLLVLLGVASGEQECSVVEHKKMQGDFRNCSRRNTEEHFNTEMGDTCELVKSVVKNCGELWNRCHTSREIRRMRDLHIEALVRQYGEQGELDSCEIVQEYRHSGRTLADPVEDETCTDEKTMEVQTKFQTCSHSTATSVYQTIQDLTSIKIIFDKLCKALTTIGTVCIKHLYQCFAEDDVRQMRKSHLQEMKTFLLRISEEKVTADVFENCKVMEYTETEEQEGIVMSHTDNNILDMENEGEHEVANNKDNEENSIAESVNEVGHLETTENIPVEITEEGSGIDSVPTTTEKTNTIQEKGARSVNYVGSSSTISTAVMDTDDKNVTEVYEKLKQTQNAVDGVPDDKGTEVDAEIGDKVVGENTAEAAVKTPEEYISVAVDKSNQVMATIASLVIVIGYARVIHTAD